MAISAAKGYFSDISRNMTSCTLGGTLGGLSNSPRVNPHIRC